MIRDGKGAEHSGHIIICGQDSLFVLSSLFGCSSFLSGVCVVLFVFGDRSTGRGDTRHVTRSEIFGNFIDWETKKALNHSKRETPLMCVWNYTMHSNFNQLRPFRIPSWNIYLHFRSLKKCPGMGQRSCSWLVCIHWKHVERDVYRKCGLAIVLPALTFLACGRINDAFERFPVHCNETSYTYTKSTHEYNFSLLLTLEKTKQNQRPLVKML